MTAIIWREFRTLYSSMLSTLLHFLTPLFLLVFFASVLGRNLQGIAYGGESVGYLEFFAPGLVGYVTFMTFQMALTFVRHDRASGILGTLKLAQGNLGGYVGGKIIAQGIINVLKAGALVCLALLMTSGAPLVVRWPNILLFISALLLGTATWFALGFALAMLLRRDDLREILVMLLSMPLIFSSSMYYDVSRAPAWIQWISLANPLTYTCNLLRVAYLSQEVAAATSELIVLGGMTVMALVVAYLMSRRAEL
jgi:ABC-2 type transport system permease protein